MTVTVTATRADVYARVTAKIAADPECGVRPWLKPWNAEHAAGRTDALRGIEREPQDPDQGLSIGG